MSSRLTLKQGFLSSVIRDGTDSYKKNYVMGEGGGEVRKGENIRVRETALNEKNSCTPSNAKKYSCTSLKNSYKGNANEKNSCEFSIIMVCP